MTVQVWDEQPAPISLQLSDPLHSQGGGGPASRATSEGLCPGVGPVVVPTDQLPGLSRPFVHLTLFFFNNCLGPVSASQAHRVH